jgi:hypothetical protein
MEKKREEIKKEKENKQNALISKKQISIYGKSRIVE